MPRGSAGRVDQVDAISESVLLLTAVARTTLFASGTLVNNGGMQLIVLLETSAVGSASLTLSVSEVHEATGTKTALLTSAAITTNALTRLRVSPHLAAAANSIAKEIVPARFSIDVAVGNANPADYKLSYMLV